MCWVLHSIIGRFLCPVNKMASKVRGTGDSCSLDYVSSIRSPEAESRAPETRSENVWHFSILAEKDAYIWLRRMPTQRDS